MLCDCRLSACSRSAFDGSSESKSGFSVSDFLLISWEPISCSDNVLESRHTPRRISQIIDFHAFANAGWISADGRTGTVCVGWTDAVDTQGTETSAHTQMFTCEMIKQMWFGGFTLLNTFTPWRSSWDTDWCKPQCCYWSDTGPRLTYSHPLGMVHIHSGKHTINPVSGFICKLWLNPKINQ